MPSRYPMFDRSKLRLLPMSQRDHLVHADRDVLDPDKPTQLMDHPHFGPLAKAILAARAKGASVILMMGAHVIKQGCSRYVIEMIRRGWVSLVALNGAGSIHDAELARHGATSESVANHITDGRFGLWSETGELNEVIARSQAEGLGYGEAIGRHISRSDWPCKDLSIFAAAYEAGVPATVHIGIGYDIIHQHPNFDASAAAAASYRDFLIFTQQVSNLQHGVLLCAGSAVMGPEVYLKALAMARNVAAQQGREIRNFTSAVFDLLPLSGDLHAEAPKDSAEYYYRPYKTILVRTVKDGGTSYYICGDHRLTIPTLYEKLKH